MQPDGVFDRNISSFPAHESCANSHKLSLLVPVSANAMYGEIDNQRRVLRFVPGAYVWGHKYYDSSSIGLLRHEGKRIDFVREPRLLWSEGHVDLGFHQEWAVSGIGYIETNHQPPLPGVRWLDFPIADLKPLLGLQQRDLAFHQVGLALHVANTVSRGLSRPSRFKRLPADDATCNDPHNDQHPVGIMEGCVRGWRVGVGFGLIVCAAILLFWRGKDDGRLALVSGGLFAAGCLIWLGGQRDNCKECGNCGHHGLFSHNSKIVQQKLLTFPSFRYTVIIRGLDMANMLNIDKQIAVIGALAEGSSIRSIERITGIHRDTIMRLGVKVGQGCTAMMDAKMRNLPCQRLEMDEIWGFVGKKARTVKREDAEGIGDVWTWCAIDSDTKLVPAFMVSDRSQAAANAFVANVASRIAYRVQISTDGFYAYTEAVKKSFGRNVDYGKIIKVYGTHAFGERRYSTSGVLSSEKFIETGNPNFDLISTSYAERLNATTRLHMRRLTRLTLAFSKKRENFDAAVGLHFAYYNFVKRHNTLRATPAQAAGVAETKWSVGELLEAVA